MTRQDLVGNIKAIAESALLFAESRADKRPDWERVLHMQPRAPGVRRFSSQTRHGRIYRARGSSPKDKWRRSRLGCESDRQECAMALSARLRPLLLRVVLSRIREA
jgi:hypothetical protein